MSNLDDVLAKAKAQASNLPAVQNQVQQLPSTPAYGGGVGFNMDLDSFLNRGGMEVESYIQVKDAGLRLNKDWSGYIDDFEATIDLTEVQQFMGIRKEVGKNVSYAKSYDGVSTTRGENFAQIIAEFQRDSQKPADPYPGFDIPMTLNADYEDPKNKANKLEAGTCVGLSTSITGFKPFATFMKKLVNAGHGNSTVKVKVTHSPRKNGAGQEYGVCEFDLIEIVGMDVSDAA